MTADPYREALDAVLEDHVGKIATITLYEILEIKGGNRFQNQARRVGEAMRGLGWEKNRAPSCSMDARSRAGRKERSRGRRYGCFVVRVGPWKSRWVLIESKKGRSVKIDLLARNPYFIGISI